jgi:hypothetical protein
MDLVGCAGEEREEGGGLRLGQRGGFGPDAPLHYFFVKTSFKNCFLEFDSNQKFDKLAKEPFWFLRRFGTF